MIAPSPDAFVLHRQAIERSQAELVYKRRGGGLLFFDRQLKDPRGPLLRLDWNISGRART
jgi:hypothetical protein